MPRLRSGNLRRRFAIQSASEAQDSLGSINYSWSTDATRWGSIEQLTADERKAHGQLQGSNTVKVVLRYYAGMTSSLRLLYGTRVFGIVSFDNEMERNHVTSVIAVEEL